MDVLHISGNGPKMARNAGDAVCKYSEDLQAELVVSTGTFCSFSNVQVQRGPASRVSGEHWLCSSSIGLVNSLLCLRTGCYTRQKVQLKGKCSKYVHLGRSGDGQLYDIQARIDTFRQKTVVCFEVRLGKGRSFQDKF